MLADPRFPQIFNQRRYLYIEYPIRSLIANGWSSTGTGQTANNTNVGKVMWRTYKRWINEVSASQGAAGGI